MRVGVRVTTQSSGGGRAFYERLIPPLAVLCDELVVYEVGPRSEVSLVEKLGVEVVPVPTSNSALHRRLVGGRMLGKQLARRPVDVLLSPGTEAVPVPDVPVVMWPLTVAPFEASPNTPLGPTFAQRARWGALRSAIKSTARHADAFVFSSHYARAIHEMHIPAVRKRPSCVIPPAPTLGRDMPHEAPLVERPFVLFVSHLYPYKMALELIRGFAAACEAGVQHHLVIAGASVDQSYRRKLDEAIASSGHPSKIHLLGKASEAELAGLYRAADLFVFPSSSENAGSFALIDAFAFGLPVLTSSMSSMPECAQNAVRYFDPRSPWQLASELVAVLSEYDSLNWLADRSQARAAELPSWVQVADRLAEFLATLAEGAEPSAVRDGSVAPRSGQG